MMRKELIRLFWWCVFITVTITITLILCERYVNHFEIIDIDSYNHP